LLDAERIQLLQSMPVFGGVSQQGVVFLMQRATLQRVARGNYFFHQGDTAASMFVIESGRVNVIKKQDGKEVLMRELGQGDCFGEMALLDLYPRSSSIVASTPCSVIEISQKALFELYREDLEQFTIIQMNIGREISRRLRLSDEQLFHYGSSQC